MAHHPFVRKSASGTARITRDSYSNADTGWWEIRAKVVARDAGVCQRRQDGKICGRPGSEVHHIVPLSRGGTTTMSNLILLCKACHDDRHAGHTIRRTPNPNHKPWGRAPKKPAFCP